MICVWMYFFFCFVYIIIPGPQIHSQSWDSETRGRQTKEAPGLCVGTNWQQFIKWRQRAFSCLVPGFCALFTATCAMHTCTFPHITHGGDQAVCWHTLFFSEYFLGHKFIFETQFLVRHMHVWFSTVLTQGPTFHILMCAFLTV